MKPDFLIVGAQKCGTTTLYSALKEHPGIYMPITKELEFFNVNERFLKGFDNYLVHKTKTRESKLLVGEASPQYFSSSVAARRICRHCPETKLVLILREPISRAYSHYLMSLRRGRESRTFGEAIHAQLRDIETGSLDKSMDHAYIYNGLYGNQVARYSSFVRAGLVKVVFQSDLTTDPKRVYSSILQFLELDDQLEGADKIHANKSGSARWPAIKNYLEKSLFIRGLARGIFSPERRRAIRFWMDTDFFVLKHKLEYQLDSDSRQMLEDIYQTDGIKFQDITDIRLPWIK